LKNKFYISFLILALLVLAGNMETYGQCSMCKTTAESDLNSGGSIATGLNTGILYLMAIPYLVLMTGGYFFFRKQVDAKIKVLKNKYFPSRKTQ
jgi:hypothetical protein